MPAAEAIIPDRISLLADVSEIVSRSHDLQETLANVIDLVAKRLDADVCSIYLTDADFEHLTLRATNGLAQDSVQNVHLRFGEGLVGWCAERAEPVAFEHAREDSHYRYFPETGEERFESLLAAPLMVQGRATGVLVIQTVESRGFDQKDIELMQTCAQLLAPVVVNAQLLAMVANSPENRAQVLQHASSWGIVDQKPSANGGQVRNELRGIPTARGIAIGPIYRMDNPVDLRRLDYLPSEKFEDEKSDLMDALDVARREIDEMRETVGERFGPEFAAVFYTQMQILEDTGFVQKLDQAMEERRNAFQALTEVLDAYRATFDAIEDPYFRERGSDVQEVGRRVMEKLLGVRKHAAKLEPGAIVVVDQVLPELFALLDMDKVAALVSEHGGATSHGAIFARTLEIPAVTGATGILGASRVGETAIVDGGVGHIYLSPDEALLGEYRLAQQKHAISVEHLDALRERPAETRDGP